MDGASRNGPRALSGQLAHQVFSSRCWIIADGGFVSAIAGSAFSFVGWNAGWRNPQERSMDRACTDVDGCRRNDDGHADQRVDRADGGQGELSSSADERVVWGYRRHWLRYDCLLAGSAILPGAESAAAHELGQQRLHYVPLHVGKAIVTTLELEGQLAVIHT